MQLLMVIAAALVAFGSMPPDKAESKDFNDFFASTMKRLDEQDAKIAKQSELIADLVATVNRLESRLAQPVGYAMPPPRQMMPPGMVSFGPSGGVAYGQPPPVYGGGGFVTTCGVGGCSTCSGPGCQTVTYWP